MDVAASASKPHSAQVTVIVALVLALLYGDFLLQHLVNEWDFATVDFPSFYFGAVSTFVDRVSPYDYGHLEAYKERINQHVFPFFYPPSSLPLFYPLTLLSYQAARNGALVVNHLLVPVTVVLLLRGVMRERNALYLALAGAVFLLSRSVAVTLLSGQINLIVLACLLVHWIAVKDERTVLSVVSLSAAILLKTYPVIFFLPLVLQARWKHVFGVLLSLYLFSAVAFFTVPAGTWSQWWETIVPAGGYGQVPPNLFAPDSPYNLSLNGFFIRMTQSVPTGGLVTSYVSLAILAIDSVLTLLLTRTRSPGSTDRIMSLLLVTSYLVAPYSWEHHQILVYPALLVVLREFINSGRYVAACGMGVVAAVLVWPIPYAGESLLVDRVAGILIYPKLYAVCVLWIVIVVLAAAECAALLRQRASETRSGGESSPQIATAG